MRRDLATVRSTPPASVHDRWIDSEAIDAALELEAYFDSDEWRSYAHAANLAAAR